MSKPTQERVLDFSYIINMVGDDAEGLITVLDTFLAQMPVYLEELGQALADQNWDKVVRCAHKIKPIFIYVGCLDVKNLIQDIEQKALHKTALASLQADIAILNQHGTAINKLIEAEKERLVTKLQSG